MVEIRSIYLHGHIFFGKSLMLKELEYILVYLGFTCKTRKKGRFLVNSLTFTLSFIVKNSLLSFTDVLSHMKSSLFVVSDVLS